VAQQLLQVPQTLAAVDEFHASARRNLDESEQAKAAQQAAEAALQEAAGKQVKRVRRRTRRTTALLSSVG
jgi:HEPN domain-containing protein